MLQYFGGLYRDSVRIHSFDPCQPENKSRGCGSPTAGLLLKNLNKVTIMGICIYIVVNMVSPI